MVNFSDFIHLPYTRDLTEGGIAYAVRSLAFTYNRMGGSSYDRLRRIVAGVAVELAFRRYLAEHDIPFDVMGATPFTDPDRYDVSLGGRRCDIKSFLITYREQIAEMKRSPQSVLNAPALVLKSESAITQIVEVGGQDAGREMRSFRVEVPPRTRIKLDEGFFSLAYVHIQTQPEARIGIHSPALQETHLISPMDWGNIWVYGMDILLAGYLTREEFSRNASPVLPGSRVFQYDRTRTKNLAVTVSELKPLSDLFERVQQWNGSR